MRISGPILTQRVARVGTWEFNDYSVARSFEDMVRAMGYTSMIGTKDGVTTIYVGRGEGWHPQ